MALSQLIDKQDNFEIIRDQIAAILAAETNNQQILAVNAGKDPQLWAFDVYTEREDPWEAWQGTRSRYGVSRNPIINVWYENASFNMLQGNTVERQSCTGIFNIDILALGSARANGLGQTCGDEDANREVQRVTRLVRNILMAAENTYLGLRGVVWRRWIQSINVMNTDSSAPNAQKIGVIRIQLEVVFNELSPQVEGVDLEIISATITRAEDGQILIEAQYDK